MDVPDPHWSPKPVFVPRRRRKFQAALRTLAERAGNAYFGRASSGWPSLRGSASVPTRPPPGAA
jgi:hypothetical protein